MPNGTEHLRSFGVGLEPVLISQTKHGLQKHLSTIGDLDRRRFVEEAILCFDSGQNRAAVVLSWVGAAWILQKHIVTNHRGSFNKAGRARFGTNFSPIRTIKDFGRLQEVDLLQLCEDAGILDKAEKQELTQRLDQRNRCGHPNSLRIGEHAAANHLETLLQNVYAKY